MINMDHVEMSDFKKTEDQFVQIGDEECEQAKRDVSADSTGLVSLPVRFFKGVLASFAKSGPEHPSGQNEKEKVVDTQPQPTWTQQPRGKSPDKQVSTYLSRVYKKRRVLREC